LTITNATWLWVPNLGQSKIPKQMFSGQFKDVAQSILKDANNIMLVNIVQRLLKIKHPENTNLMTVNQVCKSKEY
jgi:hypothetical protein